MLLFAVEHVGKSYGPRDVLKDVSFSVVEREKVAVVGANGAGKTTLLKIIAGSLEPDWGRVVFFREGVRVGYLPQDMSFAPGATVGSELAQGLGYRYPDAGQTDQADHADRIDGAVQALSGAPIVGGRGGTAHSRKEVFEAEGRVMEALSRFELAENGLEQPVSTLSGGEKTRLALARLWLEDADCLLLDEPTNHLDEGGLRWLERYVQGFPGTVVVVSHDRYFLDQTVSRVIALGPGGAESFQGNYRAYRKAVEERFERQMRVYLEQAKQSRRLREMIARQMEWFRRAHRDAGKNTEIRASDVFYRHRAEKLARRAKATIRRLERLEAERVDRPQADPAIRLQLRSDGKSGRRMVTASDVSKFFDGRCVFSAVSFAVMRGDRVGLVGPNGAGKTTLLRIIAGHEGVSGGEMWVSPLVRVAYFDQELASLADERTVLEEALSAGGEREQLRVLLGCFLFPGDSVHKRVGSLSAGEKARLALLKMLLSKANLLLLDEPTNYLDIPSRERVEEALENYDGTFVLVSHDRYLLGRVCNRILAIENGTVRVYLGGYEDYLRARSERDAASAGAGRGDKGEARAGELSDDERLLLENRLSVLASRLAEVSQDDPEYQKLTDEFISVAKRVSSRITGP
ncbi:MAG: ABC-F family ATP-binding cassette domain-containing protein [Firmicutes bacterium]|nr:ABC-F family ATP-binding cassette domain-containing protein [Bacillota bacterium]